MMQITRDDVRPIIKDMFVQADYVRQHKNEQPALPAAFLAMWGTDYETALKTCEENANKLAALSQSARTRR